MHAVILGVLSANAMALMVGLAAFVLLLVRPKVMAARRLPVPVFVPHSIVAHRNVARVHCQTGREIQPPSRGPPYLHSANSFPPTPNKIPVGPDLHDSLNPNPDSSQTHP